MTKFLAILSLFVALAAAATDCTYGENLRDFYGFANTLTAPKAYSDLKYCTSLASGSCCTDSDINTINDISTAYTKNITALVSTRDTYLKNIKDNVLPTLTQSIKDFNTAAATFTTNIQKIMESAGADLTDMDFGTDMTDIDMTDIDMTDVDVSIDPTDLLSGFAAFNNMTTQFLSQVDGIKANYGNYQTARRTCVIEMIDLQNSAMCLACDPNIETKGFTDFLALLIDSLENGDNGNDNGNEVDDDETDLPDFTDIDLTDLDLTDLDIDDLIDSLPGLFGFTIAESVCDRLQTSCKPYLAAAVGQNMLIEAVVGAQLITGFTKALNTMNGGDIEGGIAQIMTVTQEASKSDDVTTPALNEGTLPYGCDTNGKCEWICEGLFTNGMIDPLALVVGGQYSVDLMGDEETDDGQRLLTAVKRKLGDNASGNGEWAPAEGSSGVKVEFATDPANTNQSTKFGSLSLGNVFVGMMVVISSILLF